MTELVLINARIVDPSQDFGDIGSLTIADGRVEGCEAGTHPALAGAQVVDCGGKLVIPGLVDARVFVGEPGAEHRETIASVSEQASIHNPPLRSRD